MLALKYQMLPISGATKQRDLKRACAAASAPNPRPPTSRSPWTSLPATASRAVATASSASASGRVSTRFAAQGTARKAVGLGSIMVHNTTRPHHAPPHPPPRVAIILCACCSYGLQAQYAHQAPAAGVWEHACGHGEVKHCWSISLKASGFPCPLLPCSPSLAGPIHGHTPARPPPQRACTRSARAPPHRMTRHSASW